MRSRGDGRQSGQEDAPRVPGVGAKVVAENVGVVQRVGNIASSGESVGEEGEPAARGQPMPAVPEWRAHGRRAACYGAGMSLFDPYG
jgi:hypothetical protein